MRDDDRERGAATPASSTLTQSREVGDGRRRASSHLSVHRSPLAPVWRTARRAMCWARSRSSNCKEGRVGEVPVGASHPSITAPSASPRTVCMRNSTRVWCSCRARWEQPRGECPTGLAIRVPPRLLPATRIWGKIIAFPSEFFPLPSEKEKAKVPFVRADLSCDELCVFLTSHLRLPRSPPARSRRPD